MSFQFSGIPDPTPPPELPIGWVVLGVLLAIGALYFWARFLGFA
jgi:hypothetical protein